MDPDSISNDNSIDMSQSENYNKKFDWNYLKNPQTTFNIISAVMNLETKYSPISLKRYNINWTKFAKNSREYLL